ncbi:MULTISPECIES: PAS domain S-box protein [Methylobacteriaceae]|jgi:PAS domain S-box-containing protein|uniref:histidine kinase n=5 Tax=Methylobacteriaceae TaxID=119045 RepID=A0AA37HQ84_9HYPH|nr:MULTISPECIES: PAS domain S-box protein [Methylobacteriaceae]MDV2987837.1 PAS domain S-box protein [Methylobacteriaceae bacterium AG10]HEV2545578.1 PAS domain S-box protein [Methylobacterium sp.]ACB82221.1 multi-sensor hybrid histidine kinase [Methylorubrum populi BJ001]EHP94608.1 multi-sensor hybrid histidine kinase [Methylorubrum extorquens DSM 13060]KNY24026.1 histidine kinase [Methylobacterium sp. ARG-1]
MDDTVKPPPYRATPERLRRDQARIEAELAGIDGGTDPFPAAVRATRMPMVITNPRRPDNPIVFVNDAFCRLTGYAREEILGRNCRFLQGPETDPETVRLIREAIVAPRSIEIDIRNHKKDGTPFWNRLLLAPVNDAGGDLAYFFASQLDVTVERERLVVLEDENAALTAERRANLERLAFSEESLRLATEAAEVGTWDLDLTTDVLTWSDRTKAMFGISPGVPCSMADFYAGLHPDDLEVTSAAFASALDPARRATYDVEYRTVGKEDGVVRWVAAKGKGLFDARGACVRALGTAIDITARRRAEEVRQANEARLRFLDALGTETAGNTDAEGILSVTTRMVAGHLRLSNCAYADMDPDGEGLTIRGDWSAEGSPSIVGRYRLTDFGTLAATCLRSGELLVVGDVRSELPAADAASFQAVGVAAVACMPLVKDGRLTAMMAIHDRVARAWSGDDLAVLREVTERCWAHIERVRADAALREAAGQLAALNATLEQRVEERTARLGEAEAALRQSQKLEAVGQLTGGVAHDFNNLLTIIRSSVDFLRRPDLPDDRRRRYMDAVSDTVERATKLTGQLLAFARRQALKPEVFEAGARLKSVADMLDTVTGSRIRVLTELPERPCHVLADVSQFETAVINMAVNARDAMDGEGTLTLRLSCSQGMPSIRGHGGSPAPFAAVSLSDTGTGIAPELLGRIFEPFYTTKEVGKGTGLGLSQVFGFAKQSGGDVNVESAPGRGTTFTLYLPEIEAAPEPGRHETGDEATSSGAGRRVLVVEDNVEVGRFATQILQDLGFATDWAANAEEALDRLGPDGAGFHVVFSDVVMPGMGGLAMAKLLRGRLPGLPVVLASGYSDALAQGGGDGFELLHKPYAADQLGRTLNRVIRQHGRAI